MTQSELPEGWIDWNTLSLDQLADHLEKEFMFSSTGTAKAVNELVKFYRNRESLLKEREWKTAIGFAKVAPLLMAKAEIGKTLHEVFKDWYDTFINIKEQK